MQNSLRWVSLGLYAALSLFMLWFGAVYLNAKDMLWFHAAAVPEALRAQMLPLYLALMNLVGAASIGVGVIGAYFVFGPLRSGVRGAATIMTVVYVIVFVVAAVTAEELALSGAPTSWHIMGVLLGVTAAAYGAHAARAQARS